MSLSILLVCFCLSSTLFRVCSTTRVAEVKTAASLPLLDANMRRVTSRHASALAYAVDDDTLDEVLYFDELEEARRGKKNVKMWDHWGKWSPCSVTCGVGKMVRWRHCVSDGCASGEKEAQIKTCTLSPCQ